MTPEINRRSVLTSIGGGTALLLGGIGTVSADDGDDDEGEDQAGLRVAHASPDAPAVDVLVNGDVAVGGLEFRSVTDYLELAAGEYDIAVNVAGTDTTVFSAEGVELDAEDYTAVALGEVTEGADTDFTVRLFEDTNGANLDDDEARVRAIHASPDAPAVDVTVNDGALTVFDGFAFRESSGYAVVPAGTYEIEVRPDTEENDGDVVFEAGGIELEGGSTYTAFALGYLTTEDEPVEGEDSDEEFGLVLTQDASAPPRGDGDDEEEEDEEDDEDDEGEDDGNPGRGRGRGRGKGGDDDEEDDEEDDE